MPWRPLQPGELDHEKIWLSVLCGSAVLGGAWLTLGLPRPVCTFKSVTGCPCPSCGATRAVIHLSQGDFGTALHYNPSVVVGAALAAGYMAYAVAVLLLQLPRWRSPAVSGRTAWAVRIGVVLLVVLNWLWLITAGI